MQHISECPSSIFGVSFDVLLVETARTVIGLSDPMNKSRHSMLQNLRGKLSTTTGFVNSKARAKQFSQRLQQYQHLGGVLHFVSKLHSNVLEKNSVIISDLRIWQHQAII